jgi:hypothetical protein
MSRPRHLGIVLISIFAIVSGMNEVVVGLTGNFLGILSKPIPPSVATVVVGVFYSLAGHFMFEGRARLQLGDLARRLRSGFIATAVLLRIRGA